MCVSADSSFLVVGGDAIEFFSRSEQDITGLGVIEYSSLSVGTPVVPIQSVSIAPNGRFVASSSRHSPVVTVLFASSFYLDLVFGQGSSRSLSLLVSVVFSRFSNHLVSVVLHSGAFHPGHPRRRQLRSSLRAVS